MIAALESTFLKPTKTHHCRPLPQIYALSIGSTLLEEVFEDEPLEVDVVAEEVSLGDTKVAAREVGAVLHGGDAETLWGEGVGNWNGRAGLSNEDCWSPMDGLGIGTEEEEIIFFQVGIRGGK
ncbi:hypothetical protein ACLOJK_010051 [Asimina triloba]